MSGSLESPTRFRQTRGSNHPLFFPISPALLALAASASDTVPDRRSYSQALCPAICIPSVQYSDSPIFDNLFSDTHHNRFTLFVRRKDVLPSPHAFVDAIDENG